MSVRPAVALALLLSAGPAGADGLPQVRAVPLVPVLPNPPPRALEAEEEFCIQEDADGRVHFDDLPIRKGFGVVAVLLGLGTAHHPLSTRFMSESREAHVKNKYLDATELARGGRRAYRMSVRQRQALDGLPEKLGAIWRDPRLTLAERRRLLFEEWDTWTEDAAGALARKKIVAFIRRELPEGSLYGYTDYELVQLDVLRTSKEKFQPYGAP